MISNQILQNTIEGLKGISRIDFCVLDTEGKALATTFEDTWNYESAVLSFVESPADSQVIQGCQFFKIFDEQQLEYVLLAGGESEDVYMLGKIAAFQVQSLLVAYKERFDKDNFIKNLRNGIKCSQICSKNSHQKSPGAIHFPLRFTFVMIAKTCSLSIGPSISTCASPIINSFPSLLM